MPALAALNYCKHYECQIRSRYDLKADDNEPIIVTFVLQFLSFAKIDGHFLRTDMVPLLSASGYIVHRSTQYTHRI